MGYFILEWPNGRPDGVDDRELRRAVIIYWRGGHYSHSGEIRPLARVFAALPDCELHVRSRLWDRWIVGVERKGALFIICHTMYPGTWSQYILSTKTAPAVV